MAGISRLGDMCGPSPATFSPVPLVEGSSNVLVNGMPAGRVGDISSLSCMTSYPFSCRIDVMSQGSSSVFVNGIPVARMGDSIMDAFMVEGSSDVFAGG